jgi:hypothetical protein
MLNFSCSVLASFVSTDHNVIQARPLPSVCLSLYIYEYLLLPSCDLSTLKHDFSVSIMHNICVRLFIVVLDVQPPAEREWKLLPDLKLSPYLMSPVPQE